MSSIESFIYPDLKRVGFLLIKRLEVINANALSSPLTYGFPAITAFTGAVHALSRKINRSEALADIFLDGVLIAAHSCQPQTYREYFNKPFTFIQSRHPVEKTGDTAPIIQEGYCHLTVSLLIGVYAEKSDDDSCSVSEEQIEALKKQLFIAIQQQPLAGGNVIGLDALEPIQFYKDDVDQCVSELLPAFVLIDAHKELTAITQELQKDNPAATALDALIETASLHHIPSDEQENNWEIYSVKKGRGWLVPIPIGYQGISPQYDAGVMKNARNPHYPSQYVEALYSLGKWIFPYSIDSIDDAMWYQKYDAEKDLYLVTHLKK